MQLPCRFRSVALKQSSRLLKLFYSRLEACVLNSNARLCVVDYILSESQTLGDRKSVRLARNADEQPVCRAERFNIKLAGRVLDAVFVGGVYLELGVMRCRRDVRSQLARMLNDSDCKRRALCGVCARAELVKQQQRVRVALV